MRTKKEEFYHDWYRARVRDYRRCTYEYFISYHLVKTIQNRSEIFNRISYDISLGVVDYGCGYACKHKPDWCRWSCTMHHGIGGAAPCTVVLVEVHHAPWWRCAPHRKWILSVTGIRRAGLSGAGEARPVPEY
jgi:hypothetical protein